MSECGQVLLAFLPSPSGNPLYFLFSHCAHSNSFEFRAGDGMRGLRPFALDLVLSLPRSACDTAESIIISAVWWSLVQRVDGATDLLVVITAWVAISSFPAADLMPLSC